MTQWLQGDPSPLVSQDALQSDQSRAERQRDLPGTCSPQCRLALNSTNDQLYLAKFPRAEALGQLHEAVLPCQVFKVPPYKSCISLHVYSPK